MRRIALPDNVQLSHRPPVTIKPAPSPHTGLVQGNKVHALSKINKGGIKTDCVEFIEFEGSQNILVTRYQLKGSGGFFSLLPTGRPEYMHRFEARKIWASAKADGYQKDSVPFIHQHTER